MSEYKGFTITIDQDEDFEYAIRTAQTVGA